MSNMRYNLISDKSKCSCKGGSLDKFLQPNILILLAKQDLHGYLIIHELENKNMFNGEKADNTGIYRTLKTLEDKKLVESSWDLEGSGAAKKIYSITAQGRDCLANWVETLEEYTKFINAIVADGKTVLDRAHSV